jgi:hypothetical protein
MLNSKLATLMSVVSLAANSIQAIANEDAVKKYYGYTPTQLLAIPKEERDSKVPMMFIGAANLAQSPAGQISLRMDLNSLMYNGMADLSGAIKAFQRDLNEPQTGALSVGQIHELGYRASRVQLSEITFFPFNHQSSISPRRASVKGTVRIIGENIASPVNHVRVECIKEEQYCEYEQFVLNVPDRDSFSQSFSVMSAGRDIYKITRWEGDQIDAIPLIAEGCRINQLSFNFKTKEFYEIARNNKQGDCKIGDITLPKLEKPRVSEIVDGEPIHREVFARIRRESLEYFSAEFRSQVKALESAAR